DASALLARAMLQSALCRRESRGGHYRSDYPTTDPAFAKTSVARRGNESIEIRHESVGGKAAWAK
ncbi:MAG: hypothetical protein IJ074_09975, partial [Clostridia bacterium]|nr:hypothetical protein [Clostridia bacterium]